MFQLLSSVTSRGEVAKESILAGLSMGERMEGEDQRHSVGARSRYAALSKHARRFGSDIIMAPVDTNLQTEQG